jgi:hypothetical protein
VTVLSFSKVLGDRERVEGLEEISQTKVHLFFSTLTQGTTSAYKLIAGGQQGWLESSYRLMEPRC